MSRFSHRVTKAPGQLSVAAAGILLVGAFLPWRHVIMCVEVCGIHAGDWNVLQVGGNGEPVVGGSGPSTYTNTGVLVLAGAASLAVSGVLAARMSEAGRPSIWIALVMALGGLAALVGSLAAPVPRRMSIDAFHGVFLTTPGIGKWVCIVGASIGLCAAGLTVSTPASISEASGLHPVGAAPRSIRLRGVGEPPSTGSGLGHPFA